MPIAQKQEQPPSGMCAYQSKVNDGLWRCYTEEEYLNLKRNEQVLQEACINSRPMPAYPNLTDFMGFILALAMIGAFLYCTETQNWGRGLLTLFFFLCIFIFIKPFC